MNLQNVKVYYDGSHYIGIPQGAFPSGKGCKRRIVKPMKQLSITNETLLETPKERFETAYKGTVKMGLLEKLEEYQKTNKESIGNNA